MEKLFTIAGTTKFNGVNTFRVANGKLNLRRNMLRHSGHQEINLMPLPKPMTKVQAIAFLVQQGVDAVVPTRAADKTKKTAVQLEAEKIAATAAKRKATREAKKAAAEQAALEAEAAAAKAARAAKRAAKKAAKASDEAISA